MGYIQIPQRTSGDINSSTDINTLQSNCDYLKNVIDDINNNIIINSAVYSPYYVQSSAPSNPYHGWLWYNTSTNKLYKYNASNSNWVEIDWQTAIQATPEWQAGKLRISSGLLQITPNSGSNWYNCYPAIGAKSITLNDYTKKVYIPSGTSVIINNSSIPIVFAREVATQFNYFAFMSSVTLTLSDISMSYYYRVHYYSDPAGHSYYYSNSSPLYLLANSNGIAAGTIYLYSTHLYLGKKEWGSSAGTGGVHDSICWNNLPSTAYYLGTLSASKLIIITKV